jgi:hypothetical protein
MLRDLFALIVTSLVVMAFLSWISRLRRRRGVPAELLRKLTHAGTGLIFLACWRLFVRGAASKYVAGIVPAVVTFRFFMVGLGLLADDGVVKSLSPAGAREQLMRGPLAYGVVFTALTIFYWRHVLAILVAVSLCLGDGAVAALVASNIAPKQQHLRLVATALMFFVVSSIAGVGCISLARVTGWLTVRGELPIADWPLAATAGAFGALAESVQPSGRGLANVTIALSVIVGVRLVLLALGR